MGILVDASWDQSTRVGWGATAYSDKGELMNIRYGTMRVSDPLHAEAYAVLQVLTHLVSQQELIQGRPYKILTDCSHLVKAVQTGSVAELPSWSAAATVAQCVHIFASNRAGLEITKISREGLKGPHKLANWARTSGRSFHGSLGEIEETNCMVDTVLDQNFFSFEKD